MPSTPVGENKLHCLSPYDFSCLCDFPALCDLSCNLMRCNLQGYYHIKYYYRPSYKPVSMSCKLCESHVEANVNTKIWILLKIGGVGYKYSGYCQICFRSYLREYCRTQWCGFELSFIIFSVSFCPIVHYIFVAKHTVLQNGSFPQHSIYYFWLDVMSWIGTDLEIWCFKTLGWNWILGSLKKYNWRPWSPWVPGSSSWIWFFWHFVLHLFTTLPIITDIWCSPKGLHNLCIGFSLDWTLTDKLRERWQQIYKKKALYQSWLTRRSQNADLEMIHWNESCPCKLLYNCIWMSCGIMKMWRNWISLMKNFTMKTSILDSC